MEWQEILGSFVLIPKSPIAVIHFIGGAFIGSAPNFTYRWLLEALAKKGYVVIATPFIITLDHLAISHDLLNRFESILESVNSDIYRGIINLPVYGLGHSMGCKLHLLIGSLSPIERAGNIFISFNNYPIRQAIPFFEQLNFHNVFDLEFTPSPNKTQDIIQKSYIIRHNLLIKLTQDNIDETISLMKILHRKYPNLVALQTLPGNHLTPLGQEVNFKTGNIFTPMDIMKQWFQNKVSNDLYNLKNAILRWLNPGQII